MRSEKHINNNEIKNNFLARMSHDMRTPMNAIIGLIALTLDEADDAEAVRENMTHMRSVSDFMLSLINDVLDMTSLENGSVTLYPEPYTLGEILMNMKIMFWYQCQQKNIQISFRENRPDPMILVDKNRINQIFFNLLSNAVKYTQPGGRITFEIENLKQEEGWLSCDCRIQDTGIGMTDEFQKKMLEPFAQEDESVTPELQGSGLGLSITRMLVNLMGGTMQIESKKGKGTTVTVHLSLQLAARDGAGETVEKRADEKKCLRGRTILLVEDHPLNARIAIKLLEKKKIHVIHAENGRIGVEKFCASPAYTFDAVLMDIRMPEMSGLDASRSIRSQQRPDAVSVPIIAMSANAYEADIRDSLEAGMNAHLAKPIDPELLYQTLEKYISAKECPSASAGGGRQISLGGGYQSLQ
ncbi:MAG: ATP-binding protein [Lachnospiraceae bacterium]|nr:ATP-binding protein [Lachnospiraceae bacterium]